MVATTVVGASDASTGHSSRRTPAIAGKTAQIRGRCNLHQKLDRLVRPIYSGSKAVPIIFLFLAMVKNKSELQSDAIQYRESLAAMRSAHREGRILDAIRVTVASLEFVDGMMQFERRFEDRSERKTVETIDYILRYAPLVFERNSLEIVAGILKSQKRIDKHASADLAENLRKATELTWEARRLWTELEQESEVTQDKLRKNFGGEQDRWRGIAEMWDEMGLIQRIPERNSYRISLTTRVTQIVRGKCPSCGATGKAAMGSFLEMITCPRCKSTSAFVLLPTGPQLTT
jgi:hypothetical protein